MIELSEAAVFSKVSKHYALAAPLIDASFHDSPVVFANFPAGVNGGPRYHYTECSLDPKKLLWLVHREYALEFHSWAPLPNDDSRLRFGRIVLGHFHGQKEHTQKRWEQMQLAALAVRAHLFHAGLESVLLIDGWGGITLWIPLADAPEAPILRAWLHTLCNAVVEQHPDLVSTAPSTHDDKHIHLHVQSNAPGHFSALPYSLRGAEELPVCMPIPWAELQYSKPVVCTVVQFPERLQQHGDVFAKETAIIAHQRFADVRPVAAPVAMELSVR